MTSVVNLRAEKYDVFIGRPSKWGNPYIIGKDGTRAEVIEKYRKYIQANTALMTAIPELVGKKLGCYCSPAPCHGEILAELANQLEEPPPLHEAILELVPHIPLLMLSPLAGAMPPKEDMQIIARKMHTVGKSIHQLFRKQE